MSKILTWFYAFFFLVALLSTPIFYCYMAFRGILVESGMLQKVLIAISAVAYPTLFLEMNKSHLSVSAKRLVFILFSIIPIYLVTPIFFTAGAPSGFMTSLLKYGAISIPMCIMGIHVSYYKYFDKITYLLPMFVIPLALVMGTVGMTVAMYGEMLGEDNGGGGFNYQNISYYAAELFAYSIYYCFLSKIQHVGILRFVRYAMMAMVVYCPLICLMSGGRGAFVFICAVSVGTLYLMRKGGKLSNIQIAIIAVLFVVALGYFINKLGVGDTRGFNRIVERGLDSSSRDGLYAKAFDAFLSSAGLGHGLGSIWWTVGFYSHNMFLDLLAEIGLIGTYFVIRSQYLVVKRTITLGKFEPFFFFILLAFGKGFVNATFSGYWMMTAHLFLGFGVVFSYNYSDLCKYYVYNKRHK